MAIQIGSIPLFLAEVNCPHPQPFSLREKGAGFKVPLPEGEGFRVRVKKWDTPIQIWLKLNAELARVSI